MRCRQALLILTILSNAPMALAQQSSTLREATQALKPDEKLLTIDTRPGVTVRALLTIPATAPRGIVLIYPGGAGFLVAAKGGFYGAFRREFVARGFLPVVIDVPTDQPNGLEEGGRHDRFRIDPRHAQDARVVIERLKAEFSTPIYVFGHSMGAVSAAYLASTLDGLSAAILAASPTSRGGTGSNWVTVSSVALNAIRIPVLLVHHEHDGCRGATVEGAKSYPPLFSASPRVSFMDVAGGPTPESNNPCAGNNYHSFFGMRRQVVGGIIRWLNGENVTRVSE